MDTDLHNLKPGSKESELVSISDNVWIGCQSIILKRVHIVMGAVIAAGGVISTVNKEVITAKTF